MPKRAHEKLTTGATVLSSFAYVKYGLMGSKTKAARARSVSFFIFFFKKTGYSAKVLFLIKI